MIRNDNPDKGTEVSRRYIHLCPIQGLEMITPIRGRKLSKPVMFLNSCTSIRNDNPDKGTEML